MNILSQVIPGGYVLRSQYSYRIVLYTQVVIYIPVQHHAWVHSRVVTYLFNVTRDGYWVHIRMDTHDDYCGPES